MSTRKIKIGDLVSPKTEAGLWLADIPVDGRKDQVRQNVCVFTGKGVVVDIHTVTINYSSWGGNYSDIGSIKYCDCLIQCDNGCGWGGEGALIKD